MPGTVPPDSQLHFPIGLAKVRANGGREFLLIGSSNFDQRFNAGRLFSLDIARLAALVPASDPGAPEAIFFQDDFGDAIVDSVRVDSFSGDLAVVRLDSDGTGVKPHVLTPSRLGNEMAVVQLADDGQLSCRLEGSNRETGFDCTDSHRIKVLGTDAYSVGVTSTSDGRQVVAVGPLSTEPAIGGLFFSRVAFMTTDYLEQRLQGGTAAFEPEDDCNVNDFPLLSVGGVSGFISLDPLPTGESRILTTGLQRAPVLSIQRFEISAPTEGPVASVEACFDPVEDLIDERVDVETSEDIRIDTALAAFEMRGVATSTSAGRAYVTLRFAEPFDANNAGIGVIDITSDPVRILSLLEVGEELVQPSLLEREDGARLLYVGDQRTDDIFVISVTADQPQVIARIGSRGLRDLNGRTVQVNLLDQPNQIVFADVDGRKLGFVTNFSNSTLGVLDVSDPDPRRHRVIARLGRDLDPEGEREGQ